MMKNLLGKLKVGLWGTTTRKIWTIVIVVLMIGSLLIRFIAPVPPPHVALSGEPIFVNGPQWLTNSVLMTLIVDVILIVLALLTSFKMKQVPTGLQNFMEWIVETLYGLAESVAGKNATKFFPWAATLFLLIILCNWSGLVPGVGSIGVYQPYVQKPGEVQPAETKPGEPQPTETPTASGSHGFRLDGQLAMAGGNLILTSSEKVAAAPASAPAASIVAAPAPAEAEHGKFVPLLRAPTADLNVTFALAIATMVMVQIWGVRFLGRSYWHKFFTFHGPNTFMKCINAFVGILELISDFARILSFGFRLFGNIFAGEIVLATMAFLMAFLIPVPFYALEVFVGFVQALVFMMLALVFFQIATVSHGEHHDDHH